MRLNNKWYLFWVELFLYVPFGHRWQGNYKGKQWCEGCQRVQGT